MSIEILNKVNQRYLQALELHKSSCDLFTFLAMRGFAEMHRYRYYCESKTQLLISDFIITTCHVLPDSFVTSPYEPYFKSKSRLQLTPNDTWTCIKQNFADYRLWESETVSFLEDCAFKLSSDADIISYDYIKSLSLDVHKELVNVTDMIIGYSSIEWDLSQIKEEQDTLLERYLYLISTLHGKPKLYHHHNSLVSKELRTLEDL